MESLLGRMGMTPRELLRSRDPAFKELGLKDPSVPDDAILEAMAQHPGLIQRPIGERGERVVLGRPPEQILKLV